MTRGEAIDCLNGIKIYLQTEHIDTEAVDMAIEALSAETHDLRTKTHGVCLESIGYMLGYEQGKADAFAQADTMSSTSLPSAEAVPQLKQTDTLIIADALRYLIKDTERHELDRTRVEELREQILQYGASMCSSAEAVQGEWIYQTKFGRIECTACGHVFKSYVYPRNFCPNCGARMKGGDDE